MGQTIVVPLDGSDRAERAIAWAVELARATGDSITLVQVISWPVASQAQGLARYFSTDISDRLHAELDRAARDYLAGLKAELESKGIETQTEVVSGEVVATILDIADERGASAIVIASHGHGGLTRMMIGSVARLLVQQALTPVLIVRTGPGPDRQASLSKILIPLDGSSFAESALELVNDLVGSRSELILARVVEPIMTPVSTTLDIGSVIDVPATEGAAALAEDRLGAQAEALERVGLRAQRVVGTGRPASELRELADQLNVDLILMATHGRSGFDRMMLGSVADELVRTAHQPVLVVNARTVLARALEPYAVRDVMSHDAASLREDEPLSAAAAKLLRRRTSSSPVVNADGAVVGVLSEYDLLEWHEGVIAQMGRDNSLLNPAAYRERVESQVVASIMTAPAITVEGEAPLSAVIDLFLEHHLRRIPVLAHGRLVGVISRADILRTLAARRGQILDSEASG